MSFKPKCHTLPFLNESARPTNVPSSCRAQGRVGRWCLLAGVVDYFSDVRGPVPLLAPALFVVAAWTMYRVARGVWPLHKTRIVTEWGEEVAVIPHHGALPEQRKKFEEALLEAVREAREKHYEG